MKDKLIHFLNTYGNDFFHKLPKYKTAKYSDTGKIGVLCSEFIALKSFKFETLSFEAEWHGTKFEIDLFELDDFCL